jgi:hypothetical protein
MKIIKTPLDGDFDARNALSGFYLWLLFGFLSSMVSCDMQRWMQDSLMFRHFVGIVSFFFLFTILDSSNKSPVYFIWLKTIAIYFLFLIMCKSKWYFSLPVFLILIIDQSIQSQINFLKRNDEKDPQINVLDKVRDGLYIGLITLIVTGFIHYTLTRMAEFGKDFSPTTLLFAYTCPKPEENDST